MAKKRTVKQSDSIHRASEYRAVSSVATAGLIDVLISKLETTYANFPESVRRYAKDRSAIFWTTWRGQDTIKGEQEYLLWLIDGLLKLMDEATGKGHTTDATRFAFEAGLLWSMSNHAQARKTLDTVQGHLSRGPLQRSEDAAGRHELIRSEFIKIRDEGFLTKQSAIIRKMLDRTWLIEPSDDDPDGFKMPSESAIEKATVGLTTRKKSPKR